MKAFSQPVTPGGSRERGSAGTLPATKPQDSLRPAASTAISRETRMSNAAVGGISPQTQHKHLEPNLPTVVKTTKAETTTPEPALMANDPTERPKRTPFFLRRRETPQEPEQSVHEIAQEVRQRQVDMMDYGVLGSDKEIPTEANRKAVTLPHLLGYSPPIQRHYDIMRGILHAPTQFTLPEAMETTDETKTGDVLYEQAGKNHSYYFGNNITEPYTQPFQAISGSEPWLMAYIGQNNETEKGAWTVGYDFLTASPLDKDSLHFDGYEPQRDRVLEFWYSPTQLTAPAVRNHMQRNGAALPLKYVNYLGEGKKDGFRSFQYVFDAPSLADKLAGHDLYNQAYDHDQVLEYLRNKGQVPFSVVEVGTVTLGNNKQKHWVYTGSENAQVQQKQERRVWQGILKPRLAEGNG